MSPKPSWRKQLLYGVLLVAIVWFGSFCKFDRFSLYADDVSYIGGTFFYPNTFQNYLNNVARFSDGRPIQYGLIDLTAAIVTSTSSFGPAYLFLFALTAASVLATWRALAYRFSHEVAVTAAALLALSPLLSIRAFLNGIASPVALLMLLVASMLYASRRWISAYLVSALILLSYELTFPTFVLLPTLLRPLRSRGDVYRLILHAVICLAMVAGYSVLKTHLGSERVEGALAGHSPAALGAGILEATGWSAFYGLWGNVDVPLWLRCIVPSAGAVAWGIWALFGFGALLAWLARGREAPELPERPGLLMGQTLAVLLLMVLAGYSLVYFGSSEGARQVLGRGSRFHSVAMLPWSILGALLLWGLIDRARGPRLRGAVIGTAAVYFALLFAFSVSHQDDFEQEAERQKLMVTQLVLDHPHMDPKATFMLEEPMLNWRHQPSIEYDDGHSFYYLLPYLFDFGPEVDGRSGPAIRLLQGDQWPARLKLGPGDEVDWPGGAWPSNPEQAGHVWAYKFSMAGELTPNPGPILVDGRNILHDGPETGDGLVDLSKAKRNTPLYDLMLGRQAAVIDATLRHGASGP